MRKQLCIEVDWVLCRTCHRAITKHGWIRHAEAHLRARGEQAKFDQLYVAPGEP